MFFKLNILTACLFTTMSSSIFAGTMGSDTVKHSFYLGVEGGGSVSTEAHLEPVVVINVTSFHPLPNATFNRDIGTAGFVGAFVGYDWNQNVSLQFGYAYRSGYSWRIDGNSGADFSNDPFETYEARGIKIQTYLVDLILKPTVDWGGFVPFVKGGIGVSSNKIGSFADFDVPTYVNPVQSFNTVVDGHTSTNFAWDAGLGADYFFNKNFSLGFSYRFVGAGPLQTGTHYRDTVLNDSGTVQPVRSKNINLNEFSASITYHFN
ncbi:outer membrane protein [Legionella saoudiensis]|uniref:outer membrane protein n=1 Tax=Legionella saoudiensis TaxID=1750561 RepID=UPI000731A2EA|nr:outer membrane beta-barrel protein [Legionella saoudiensis]